MRPPTLADVAKKAGVSLSTASAALAGLKIVRDETRRRILAAARSLGYRRNAAAAIMAAGRQRARKQERAVSLGYLQSPTAEEKKPQAFERRAAELGYAVEWVDLRAFRSPGEASRALYFRNVAGLFYSSPGAVPPGPEWLAQFNWDRFAVVKFTRSRPELRFPLIRHSAFDYAERSVREVFAAGYRRVAVLLERSTSPVDDHARLGAVLGWKAIRLGRGMSLAARFVERAAPRGLPDEIMGWLRKERPGAVIGFPDTLFWRLKEAGADIPGDFAFAGMIRGAAAEGVAGCGANLDLVRVKAAEMLHQMIVTGQRGMSESPTEIVIEPEWVPGPSLPCGRDASGHASAPDRAGEKTNSRGKSTA